VRRPVFGSRVSFVFSPGPAARKDRAADGKGLRTRMWRQDHHVRARDAEAPRFENSIRRARLRRILSLAVLSALLGSAAPGIAGEEPTKFSVAPDGRLLKDGQPYFFIGMAPGPRIDLKTPEGDDGWAELAAGGVNVVRGGVQGNPRAPGYAEPFEKYLDVARAHGMFVWPYLSEMVDLRRPGMRQRLVEFVTASRNKPAVMFWKSAD